MGAAREVSQAVGNKAQAVPGGSASLSAAQLGMGPSALLKDWQTFGLLFESLCMRDLMVYARSLADVGFEPVRYYRDDTGLEADAIVELADGRWAAFVQGKRGQGAGCRREFAALEKEAMRKQRCSNARARVLAVITGISTYARQTPEGVYVIPIRAMTA